MIIELFGPPGAGKTTFARALTMRLRESGHVAELMTLSHRPAERRLSPEPRSPAPAELRVIAAPLRLSRPLFEMLAIARHPLALSHDIGAATGFMKLLPPRNLAVAVRLSQYIMRLSNSWNRAAAAGHIVLFDQGFVQLVCSLVLLGRSADEPLVAQALDASPRSDLLIRLDAPLDLLSARLKERESRQSTLERLFEPGLRANLKSRHVIEQLHRLLLDRGRSVACAASLDGQSLRESVAAIETNLTGTFDLARGSNCGNELASDGSHRRGRHIDEACRHA